MACVSRRLVRLIAASAFIPLPALAGEIEIPLDNVITITLDQPARTVYLANPGIADITKIDPRHFFILGKTYGTTNLVVLDGSGRETANEQLIVTERAGRPITVQRGTGRAAMVCTDVLCEPVPTPGDAAPANNSDQGPVGSGGGNSAGGGGLTANAGGVGSAIGQSLGGK